MGIGIMKRVRNKLDKFLHKRKKNEVPQYDIELNKQPVCGNCKHFKRVGYNGVVGVCTHEKALHHTIANKLDTYESLQQEVIILRSCLISIVV